MTGLFPPYSLWQVSPFVLVPLIWAVWGHDWQDAFRTGWISGLVFFALLLYWLVPTISRFGNLPLAAACPVIGLLVCYLALFTAAWAAAVAYLSQRNGPEAAGKGLLGKTVTIVALSLLWGLIEWLRGLLLSGFPWGSLAYCLAPQPLLFQIADISGPYAIGSVIVFLNFMFFCIWQEAEKLKGSLRTAAGYLAAAAAVCAAVLGYGAVRYNAVAESDSQFPAVDAAAIQGSLPQEQKWAPGIQKQTVKLYTKLTLDAAELFEKAPAPRPAERLVIWPETAMPFFFQDGGTLSELVRLCAVAADVNLLFGTPAYGKERGQTGPIYYNRACLLDRQGTLCGCYDKRHLVPFGEYLPWGPLTSWARKLVPAAGNFSAGTSAAPLSCGQIKTGVLICFESIFPEIARQSVRQGANLLAIITNDSWFGDTGAPWQHADIAAFRAVESRRYVVRAANTGVSEIIAPTGQVVAKSSLFRQDIVTGRVRLRKGETPYTATGDLPFLALSVCFIILTCWWKFRTQRTR